MYIDNIIFPKTPQSQQSDEDGYLNQLYRFQFKEQQIPETQGLDQNYKIKSTGRLIYLKSDFNNILTFMPIQYEKSSQCSEKYVIYFHMNSDDLGDVFRVIDKFTSFHNGINVNVLAMEQPGQGTQRNAQCSEDLLIHNAAILYDFVKNHFNAKDEQIQLQGRSIGTCIALKLASIRKPAAVMLVSPLQSIRQLARKQVGGLSCIIKNQFNLDEYYKNITAKIFILHGEQDSVVPVDHAQLIKEKMDSLVTLKILRKSNHQNITNGQIQKSISDWLHQENIYLKESTPKVTNQYNEFPNDYQRQIPMPDEHKINWCVCMSKQKQKQVILNEKKKESEAQNYDSNNSTQYNNKHNQDVLKNDFNRSKQQNYNLNTIVN